jgi:hypothetical protein
MREDHAVLIGADQKRRALVLRERESADSALVRLLATERTGLAIEPPATDRPVVTGADQKRRALVLRERESADRP